MDELVRTRRLLAAIQAKTAAINSNMGEVQARLESLDPASPERARPDGAAEAEAGLELLALPDEVIAQVCSCFPEAAAVAALAATCRRLRRIAATDAAGWRRRCEARWHVTGGPSAAGTPCLANNFAGVSGHWGVAEYFEREYADWVGNLQLLGLAKEEYFTWKGVYYDRVFGHRCMTQMFDWLAAHGCPGNVSGRTHKLEVHLAVQYLFLFSRVPGSPVVVGFLQRNRLVLSCLLALLDNTSGSVVELAAGAIANLLCLEVTGSSTTLDLVADIQSVVAEGVPALVPQLLSTSPGVKKEVARALFNLWAFDGGARIASPDVVRGPRAAEVFRSGVWLCQEFSARGELITRYRLRLALTEDHGLHGSSHASGQDVGTPPAGHGEFGLRGRVDAAKGEFRFEKRYVGLDYAIGFEGYCSRVGLWGTFAPERVATSFFASRDIKPQIFHLAFCEEFMPPCRPAYR